MPGRFAAVLILALFVLWGPLGWAQSDDGPATTPAASDTTSDPGGTASDTTAGGAPEDDPEDDSGGAGADAEEAAPQGVAKKVVFGDIDGEIGLATAAFVTRLVDQARVEEADAILLRINTFGGRVDAAVAIRDTLIDAEPEVAIFIDKRAISAGALISLACDHIAISAGGTIGAATPIVQSSADDEDSEGGYTAVGEKYMSYFRQEMRSTAEAQGRDGDIAAAMVDEDVEIEGVIEKGKLLTLTTKTALEYGIADFEAADEAAVLAHLGWQAEPIEVVHSWSEDLVGFLTSQAIASLLFLGMMVFGYLEWQTPGVGVFGAVALVCFLLLYFSHYMVNLAGYEELIFFAIGVVLILVELFILPGFGVAGLLGAASIIVSMVMMLMAGDWSDLHLENPFTFDAVEQVAYILVASFGIILLMFRYLPRTPVGRGVVLGDALVAEAGFTSHEAIAPDLIGAEGVALTGLRPSGKARLDGQRVRVEADGEWIDKGERVKVTRHVEGRVVVRRVSTSADVAAEPREETA